MAGVRWWSADRRPRHGEDGGTPNLSVKGYDLIAAIKTVLEGMCPGVVSFSDIQILATRDAVALTGGPAYAVRTGRRDRRQSRASDVRLPAPDYTAAQAVAYYARLGMNAFETVALLGAHTVGTTRCSAIKSSRLYGYGGKHGATDPDMDPAPASVYKKWVCPNVSSSDGNAVFLDDQWSALKVDNHYYRNLQLRHGQARPWGCDMCLRSGPTRPRGPTQNMQVGIGPTSPLPEPPSSRATRAVDESREAVLRAKLQCRLRCAVSIRELRRKGAASNNR
jgi:hypothetical protein